MPTFSLPDLGEGLTEAQVLRWMVAEGDEVVIDQPVVEVETAKAAVEVPIPFAGVVTGLLVEEGAVAKVGSPLIVVDDDSPGGPATGAASTAAEAAAATPPTRTDAEGFHEPGVAVASSGSGNVLIGYGTPDDTPRRRRRRAATPALAPVSPPFESARPGQGSAEASSWPAASSGRPSARGVISPVVRRLARDAGIDLTSVIPADGEVIRRADVERAIAARHVGSSTAGDAREERIPLDGARGFVAEKLSRSRREIPEATVWVDVDATRLLEARRTLSAPEQPVSVLALLSRFVVAGLRRFPELNARVEDGVIHRHRQINLGFAAQTDRGLVVPIVRDAQSMSLRQLAASMGQRTEQAREGALAAADLTGGTFTVNNYGVFGVDGSAAIINHPEVAILGIGRIIDRPWAVDGELAVRKVAQLTIAFDHRVCDGGVAGGFLRFVADCVENPLSVLMEV